MERAAMKLLDRLRSDQRKASYLLARLRHCFAGMTHFTNQFLRRFSIFTQQFGGLFKYVQHLADTALLSALEIG